MRVTTKLKILRWVEKLLGLPDTRNIPPFKVERRDIQRIQSVYAFMDQEADRVRRRIDPELMIDHIKKELSLRIANEMLRIGAIKFDTEFDMRTGEMLRITATTYIPEKL